MERYRQSCFVCVLRPQVPIFDEAVEVLMDAVHGAGGGGGGGGERPPRRLSRRPPTRYETRVCAPAGLEAQALVCELLGRVVTVPSPPPGLAVPSGADDVQMTVLAGGRAQRLVTWLMDTDAGSGVCRLVRRDARKANARFVASPGPEVTAQPR
jgi:hypothetical protein